MGAIPKEEKMTNRTNKDCVLDIRAHFGFSTLPFTREIPIKDRWHSDIFDQPLTALRQTIEQRMSSVVLAPSGTGKTLVLRTLRAELPEARYRVHYVKLTSLSRKDLCREIGLAAGFDLSGIYPVVFRMLQQRLRQFDEDGLRPVLLLDDTQDMSPLVLTTLRILTNFDMDSRLVLSLVLAGDNQLRHMLESQPLEPIRRRMAHIATLRLLSRAETRDYMQHRVRVAGAQTFPFDTQAVDAVFEVSRGNLRAIDQLARKSLELAAQKTIATVDPSLVAEARPYVLI
jgi:type II secretory pathway predicted ATPase ExeA